jgi:hypothetical protein
MAKTIGWLLLVALVLVGRSLFAAMPSWADMVFIAAGGALLLYLFVTRK